MGIDEMITIYDIRCLPRKEAPQRGHVQCTAVPPRPTACLALTRWTLDALPPLVPPVAAAFPAPRTTWRRAGTPRTARQCAVSKPGPGPPSAARLCCLLPSLKTSSRPGVQGRLGGLGQSPAPPGRPGLRPALWAARRPRGAAPARALAALAPRRGGTEGAAAAGASAWEAEPAPVAPPASPLGPLTGRPAGGAAPQPLRHRPRVRAARQTTLPATRGSASTPCSSRLCLSAPSGGRGHAKRRAAAPPAPWPAKRRLGPALGGLACTRPQVESLRPPKPPGGEESTRGPPRTPPALPQRRRRLEHGQRRGKRGRLVTARIRWWQAGSRALVRALGWALHHVRVRLHPWVPMM
jgi:hypothetical protein